LKFLLDENLSSLFIEKIKQKYPGSVGIFDIGYDGKDDIEIYDFLKHHEYILITFDLDFSDIRKFPPEFVEGIIVLRFKNKKIQDLISTTLSYLEELKKRDFEHSLVIFQNSGFRIKKRLKVIQK
jgi:predicted nuclease of predicted toxin-antitoxin system